MKKNKKRGKVTIDRMKKKAIILLEKGSEV